RGGAAAGGGGGGPAARRPRRRQQVDPQRHAPDERVAHRARSRLVVVRDHLAEGPQDAVADVERDRLVRPDGRRPLEPQRLLLIDPPLVWGGAEVVGHAASIRTRSLAPGRPRTETTVLQPLCDGRESGEDRGRGRAWTPGPRPGRGTARPRCAPSPHGSSFGCGAGGPAPTVNAPTSPRARLLAAPRLRPGSGHASPRRPRSGSTR